MTDQQPLPAACLSCAFFLAATSEAFPEVDGMCRRYAPQGPVIGSHRSGWQIFPPMLSTHWCGEYQPHPVLQTAWAAKAQAA